MVSTHKMTSNTEGPLFQNINGQTFLVIYYFPRPTRYFDFAKKNYFYTLYITCQILN